MLVRQGDARTIRLDRQLACTLAMVAGAVNTAAFQAVGFFAANMTGNASALSGGIALGEIRRAAFYLLIVTAFVGGSTCSTLLINTGRRQGMRGIYALSVLAEGLLMALLVLADIALAAPWKGRVLVLGLSFLMGLQNAVVTRISDARIRTTHISGMATDLGIGLGMVLDALRGKEIAADPGAVRARLQLHAVTIASFIAGGILGVLAYRRFGDFLLFGCAAVLLAVALPSAIRARWRAAA